MTQPGDGFDVDIPALKAAIEDLKAERDTIGQLMYSASNGIKPGELVANDRMTSAARKAIEDIAVGQDGSLTMALRNLTGTLDEKIAAYEATIKQYQRDDEEAMPNSQLPSES